jgi:hypothetical protein
MSESLELAGEVEEAFRHSELGLILQRWGSDLFGLFDRIM